MFSNIWNRFRLINSIIQSIEERRKLTAVRWDQWKCTSSIISLPVVIGKYISAKN